MNGPLDQVASWPVRTAAVAVMSPAGLLAARGPLDRPFSWASVTKLLTTLAALDVVQRGLLDLDEPAGPPGATIRHLLAHASGLGPRGDKVLSKPGRQRIYSNRGIEIVAHATAARAGKPFGPLLAEEICRPLGLRRTHLAGSPSWGAAGPLGDLAALGSELLSPSLVDSELLAEATRTAFPRPARRGAGLRPPAPMRLGTRVRDTRQQGAALDRIAELAGDLRSFRSLRQFPVGRSRSRPSLRRPHRPGLRSLGGAGLAAPVRRHPHLLRQRVTGRGRPGAAGRRCTPPAPSTCGGAAPDGADAGSRD